MAKVRVARVALVALVARASIFEVASVRPVNPPAGPHVVSLNINHGTLKIDAAELRQIVGLAYAIQRVRVVGGPGWADSDQFDILAKAAENPDVTRDEIRSMLQSLLADRFHLAVHRESKAMPAYVLLLAKSGSKLKESPADGRNSVKTSVTATGQEQTIFEASPLRILVNMLANTLGGPVVDKTGLDKLYSYTFQWPTADSSMPALLGQLGLKLEARKEPVEVLVIDHVEKPSAN